MSAFWKMWYNFKKRGMSHMRKTEIEKKAKELIKNNDFPIDVVKIANELGFNVFLSDFDEANIAGMVVNSPREKSIYINKDDIPQRQRFTIAHEIGHIILHHQNNGDFKEVDFRNTDELPTQKEIEANAFAATLLMPKEQTVEMWNILQDIDDIANYFKVSKAAAAIRLMN